MIYCILADGFEEIEALTPIDMLRRAGLSVTVMTLPGNTEARAAVGAHQITVLGDAILSQDVPDDIDMLILPGGMPGAKHIDESPVADKWIRAAAEQGAYLCAICAAPMILGKRGLLDGHRAVCYPGFEQYLTGAAVENGAIAVDGHRITACGMGAAMHFGAALVAAMKGEEAARKVWTSILADRT